MLPSTNLVEVNGNLVLGSEGSRSLYLQRDRLALCRLSYAPI